MQLIAETADVLRDDGDGSAPLLVTGRGRSLTVRAGVELDVAGQRDRRSVTVPSRRPCSVTVGAVWHARSEVADGDVGHPQPPNSDRHPEAGVRSHSTAGRSGALAVRVTGPDRAARRQQAKKAAAASRDRTPAIPDAVGGDRAGVRRADHSATVRVIPAAPDPVRVGVCHSLRSYQRPQQMSLLSIQSGMTSLQSGFGMHMFVKFSYPKLTISSLPQETASCTCSLLGQEAVYNEGEYKYGYCKYAT